MKRVCLIVNSKAGTRRDKEGIVKAAERRCGELEVALTVKRTRQPGDAERMAREAAQEGADTVIIAGGDGTVRDAASGLWQSDSVMAIIPLGSGNGLARSMGVPMNEAKALEIALGDSYKVIDRGVANGQPYYTAFGVGFDAEVSYKFANDGKRGKATYVKHAVKEMFSYKPRHYRIVIDGKKIETDAILVAVCNCCQYGNDAFIAPKADPADGLLDITVVRADSFFSRAKAGVQLLRGSLDKHKKVDTYRAQNVSIEVENNKLMHLDGEPLEGKEKTILTCEPMGLKVASPAPVRKR